MSEKQNPLAAATPDIYARYGFNPFQFTPGDAILADFHARQVPYFQGCRQVIDLGAGRGLFLKALADHGIRGVGVESHADSIAVGRRHNLEYQQQDIFEFFGSAEGRRIARESDGVYCCHVLEHLAPDELFELFRLTRNLCAPQVRCRFITNNPEDISVLGYVFWADLTHRRLYPAPLLEAMARSQGFTTATATAFLGMRLGRRDSLRRWWDKLIWGRHKWLPNLRLDCQ